MRERVARRPARAREDASSHDVFQDRFKNFTNRLDDTSSIKKAKRDLARVKTILTERAKGLTPVAKAAKPAKAAADAPPSRRRRGGPEAKAKKAAAALRRLPPRALTKPAAAKRQEDRRHEEERGRVVMTENANVAAAGAPNEAHGFRRKMIGKVIQDKMHKTVVVEVRELLARRALRQVRRSRARASRRTTRPTSTRSATKSRSRSTARSRATSASSWCASSRSSSRSESSHDPDANQSSRSPTTPARSASSASRCWAGRVAVTPASATSSSSPSRRRSPARR